MQSLSGQVWIALRSFLKTFQGKLEMSKLFKRLKKGLEEALAHAEGKTALQKSLNVLLNGTSKH